MTFEVGKTYRTRQGGNGRVIDANPRLRTMTVEYDDGWFGCPNDYGSLISGKISPRDLLPGAIEDAGGGEVDVARGRLAAWRDASGKVHTVPPIAPPATPEPDTKWDRDARAALTGLLAAHQFSDAGASAARFADQMAAERARRGEVG